MSELVERTRSPDAYSLALWADGSCAQPEGCANEPAPSRQKGGGGGGQGRAASRPAGAAQAWGQVQAYRPVAPGPAPARARAIVPAGDPTALIRSLGGPAARRFGAEMAIAAVVARAAGLAEALARVGGLVADDVDGDLGGEARPDQAASWNTSPSVRRRPSAHRADPVAHLARRPASGRPDRALAGGEHQGLTLLGLTAEPRDWARGRCSWQELAAGVVPARASRPMTTWSGNTRSP